MNIPHLASLIHAQTNVLTRHVYEHVAQHNTADTIMLRDDIDNVRCTLDKIEQELEKEKETQKYDRTS